MRNVVILDAHPRAKSLVAALAEAYAQGAIQAAAQVHKVAIRDLQFNPLEDPMKSGELEDDLKRVQGLISDCHHLVIVFPTWWTSVPAQTKGFLDRTFRSGWAFKYSERGFPKGLLSGRSARIIHTCGAPAWANKWIYGEPEVRMMRDGILKFCGFGPVKITKFGGVMGDDPNQGASPLKECFQLGLKENTGF